MKRVTDAENIHVEITITKSAVCEKCKELRKKLSSQPQFNKEAEEHNDMRKTHGGTNSHSITAVCAALLNL
jgi:hypothetical protein